MRHIIYLWIFFISAVCEGEVLTDDEGFVASPDYPKPYSRLTDCDWTIRVCCCIPCSNHLFIEFRKCKNLQQMGYFSDLLQMPKKQ